jgi:hypothetical protein
MVRCGTGGFDVVAKPISIVSVAQTIPFRIAITRSLSFTRLIRQQAAITPLEIRQLVTLHDQVARRTGAFESISSGNPLYELTTVMLLLAQRIK